MFIQASLRCLCGVPSGYGRQHAAVRGALSGLSGVLIPKLALAFAGSMLLEVARARMGAKKKGWRFARTSVVTVCIRIVSSSSWHLPLRQFLRPLALSDLHRSVRGGTF